jgi:hypothetical protein
MLVERMLSAHACIFVLLLVVVLVRRRLPT